jgi:hypothetical protein
VRAFNVWKGRKLIDTVFYAASSTETKDDVYRSLVNHDGYDPDIRVTRRYDYEWEVQGQFGQGWEMVTTEETAKAGREQLRTYRENDTQHPYRLRRVRVK